MFEIPKASENKKKKKKKKDHIEYAIDTFFLSRRVADE